MGWPRLAFWKKSINATPKSRGPPHRLGFLDLAFARKSSPPPTEQKVVIPKFALSFQGGIIHPNIHRSSMFSFQNMAKTAEECLVWRSVLQALLDTLKINPIEIVKAEKADEIDPIEETFLRDFIIKANRFDQTLDDVEMEWQQDCHEVNNGWVWVIKRYVYPSGITHGQKPIGGIVSEIFRGDPALFRWSYKEDLNPMWVRCPMHIENIDTWREGAVQLCPDCGSLMLPVKAVSTKTENGSDVENYFIDGEVYHLGRWHSGRGGLFYYTYPLVSFVWELLTWMEIRNHKAGALMDKKAPDGILAIFGSNPDEIVDWHEESMRRMADKDYRDIPLLTGRSDGKGSGVQFINLLGEILKDFPEMSKEIRNSICGFYGVSPAFISDIKDLGGLHSDEKQIPITQMKGEGSLNLSNRRLFPWLVKQMGLKTVMLEKPSVWQEGENQKTETKSLQADLAKKHLDMGGQVEFDGEEYILHEGPLRNVPGPMGPMGYGQVEPNVTTFSSQDLAASTLTVPSESALEIAPPSPIKEDLEKFMKARKKKDSAVPRKVGQIRRDIAYEEDKYIQGLTDIYLKHVQAFEWREDRKPTKSEMSSIFKDMLKDIQAEWKNLTDSEMAKIFKLYTELAYAEEKLPLGPWKASDEAAMNEYLNDQTGVKSFLKNYPEMAQNQIMNVVGDHLGRDIFDRTEFVKDLRDVATGATEARIQTMANTEFSHAVDLARKHAWEDIQTSTKETVFVEWYGPLECPVCKSIARSIKSIGGCIELDKLDDLVRRYAKDSRGWRPHPNCKCSITRCFSSD